MYGTSCGGLAAVITTNELPLPFSSRDPFSGSVVTLLSVCLSVCVLVFRSMAEVSLSLYLDLNKLCFQFLESSY